MRFSSKSKDPGYENYARLVASGGKKMTVFLNGKEVKFCTMADEELGRVTYLVADEKGKLQVDPNDPDCIWEELAYGKVEVRIT